MNTIRFDNLLGAVYFIFPVAVAVLYILSGKLYKKGVFMTGSSGLGGNFSYKVFLHYLSVGLVIGGMFVIAISLMKPQYGIKKEKVEFTGIDIMIVLDVSPSMLTQDYINYTRIDVAKGIIENFIDRRKGDRMGMVTFSTDSMIKAPATTNYDLLKRIVDHIQIDPEKSGSTSLGIGLASGINRLTKLKDNKNNASKVIILITDGRNNSGEITPEAATEIAKNLNIKVYTIGIGSNEEVDMDLLKNISEMTHGKFFHAQTSKQLDVAFDEIDKLEKQKIETVNYTRFNSVGFGFANAGMLLLIIGLLGYSIFFRRLG